MHQCESPKHDPYWEVVIHLFSNHNKLSLYLIDEYINIDKGIIDQNRLLKASKTWSRSEKFLLKLALHLYSNQSKLDLNEMDCLDQQNKQLVIEAIQIRFGRG